MQSELLTAAHHAAPLPSLWFCVLWRVQLQERRYAVIGLLASSSSLPSGKALKSMQCGLHLLWSLLSRLIIPLPCAFVRSRALLFLSMYAHIGERSVF